MQERVFPAISGRAACVYRGPLLAGPLHTTPMGKMPCIGFLKYQRALLPWFNILKEFEELAIR